MTRHINLYNPELLPKRDWASARNLAIGSGFAVFVMAGSWAVIQSRTTQLAAEVRGVETQFKEAQRRLAAASKEMTERKPSAQLVSEVSQAESRVNLRRELVQTLEGGSVGRTEGFSEHMRAFARQSLNGLWLTGFSLGGSGEMEIKGRVTSPELVPIYLRRLNGEKVFQGRTFAMLSMKGGGSDLPVKSAEPAMKKPESAAGLPPHIEFMLTSREANGQGMERRP